MASNESASLSDRNGSCKSKSLEEKIGEQAAAAAIGAAVGAVTHKPWTPRYSCGDRRNPTLATQVGSAMGAAAFNGAGFSGTMAAGAGIVTAKLITATAVATAAAPAVLALSAVAAIGYGLFKLSKK